MWNLLHKLQLAMQATHRHNAEDSAIAAPPPESAELARLKALAEMVAKTGAEECGCDDVYELIDQYAESVLQGQDPALLMPQVKHHLDVCQGCCEEYEMLLQIMQMEET